MIGDMLCATQLDIFHKYRCTDHGIGSGEQAGAQAENSMYA
jgi:hypothetical protein